MSAFGFLKNHPFAVEAFFESSLVLTYAAPKESLSHLIPSCIELDVFDNKWAFVAVAMVQTKDLRPKGFPKFLGNDFFLIGYRIFVRYTTSDGKRLRGLYILKSETNKKKMEFLGNLFTHYRYTTSDIDMQRKDCVLSLHSIKSQLNVELNLCNENVALPGESPFRDWKEARRFAGPLPFTFTVDEQKNEVLIIEGVRENWTPTPVEVTKHEAGFINELGIENLKLANAFIVENIPYYWKKGRLDKRKKQ